MKVSDITTESEIKDIIEELKAKTVEVPPWKDLEKEYDVKEHPVMDTATYRDKVTKSGIEKVTRITLGLQKLATKRMTGLMFGIPVKRVYEPEDENQKKVAELMENIYTRTRIDKINRSRSKMMFAGCEVVTLWYSVEEKTSVYGEPTNLKLRCKNYSPMEGYSLYPLFDDNDDMIALSVGYQKKVGSKNYEYFDVFTSNEHIRYVKSDKDWEEEINEPIILEKIPAVYYHRESPIWEDTSNNVYEMEWALSRNGNYLRKNSKPVFGVFSDEDIKFGSEDKDEDRLIVQYPTGADAKYITWDQATDNLKLQIEQLTRSYFMELQLPDISHESMKAMPMSGEARKMMFIDAQLKVTDESGDVLEMLDRECNIIKAHMKIMWPKLSTSIDELQVEQVITPYQISDEKETIENLMTATGGKPIISQREAIEQLGWSNNADETLAEMKEEERVDSIELG